MSVPQVSEPEVSVPDVGVPDRSVPDVSVVVAVYNTMPYLTACLKSLVEQSIGRGRMEIIAVDDGSTDGSGAELDRFARRYPDTMTVLHQRNSGGPAVPSNRALDLARGRYVYFVGSDDYLGTQALARMVSVADRLGSDVVVGKMVGVNSRFVEQTIFERDQDDISLFDSALPYSLGNAKLFRRELIERHGLRFPTELAVGSDQPFTVEACYRAGRISVLANYVCYYAVRRLDARNITYQARYEDRLRFAGAAMDFVAGLIEPGQRRDAILVRHFNWELAWLLDDGLLRTDRAVRHDVHTGVRELIRRYLNDDIRRQLGIEARLRLSAVEHGTVDHLLAVIERDATVGVPPTTVDGGRWFAAYPGFRDGQAIADDAFDVTSAKSAWIAKLDATSVTWRRQRRHGRALTVEARSPLPHLPRLCFGAVRARAGDTFAETFATTADDNGTALRFQLSVDQLLAASQPTGQRWGVHTHVTVRGVDGTAPMRAPRLPPVPRLICRRGARLYAIAVSADPRGQLTISVAPLSPGRIVAWLRRLWAAYRTTLAPRSRV